MTVVCYPWQSGIFLIFLFGVTSGIRVYQNAGVALKEKGHLLAFEDVESLAFNVVIKKPSLRIPGFIAHDLAKFNRTLYNTSDIERTRLQYDTIIESLKGEVDQKEENLRFWIPDNERHNLWRSTWYHTYKDEERKFAAKKKAEEELSYGDRLQDELADEPRVKRYRSTGIRVSKNLLETYEDMTDPFFPFFENTFHDFERLNLNFYLFWSSQSHNVEKYTRRLRELEDALSASQLDRRPLAGLLEPHHVLKMVKELDTFANTIFREYPLSLYQFGEVDVLNLTITDNFLSLLATVTFPILKEENILPQFDVVQVGYITRENGTRCVKHVLPKRVTLLDGSYYEMTCDRSMPHLFGEKSMPQLCRVDFINVNSQLSCFNGEYVDCLKLPVQCDQQDPHYLEEGLLVSSTREVERITEGTIVQKMEQSDGAIFVPWEGTISVVVGDQVHHNPDVITTNPDLTHHSNDSYIFDIEIRYSETDLMLLKSDINLTTGMQEDEILIRYITEKRKELERMILAHQEEKRRASLNLVISLALSGLSCVALVILGIVHYCNKRYSLHALVRCVQDDNDLRIKG